MTNILEYHQLLKISKLYENSISGEVFKFHSKFIGMEVLVPELGYNNKWFIHGFELIQGSSSNYRLYLKDYKNEYTYLVEPEKLKYFYDDDSEPVDFLYISKFIVEEYKLTNLAKLYGILINGNN